jgi:hypothetical protein
MRMALYYSMPSWGFKGFKDPLWERFRLEDTVYMAVVKTVLGLEQVPGSVMRWEKAVGRTFTDVLEALEAARTLASEEQRATDG